MARKVFCDIDMKQCSWQHSVLILHIWLEYSSFLAAATTINSLFSVFLKESLHIKETSGQSLWALHWYQDI